MTAIAWDGKMLAGDKRACVGMGNIYTTTKVFRVGASLVGVSGSIARAGAFIRWLESGADPTKVPENPSDDHLTALVISDGGKRIERYEGKAHPIVVEDRFAAIGTGAPYVRMAMHLGMTARKAVELACIFDENCGNGIDTLTFKVGR